MFTSLGIKLCPQLSREDSANYLYYQLFGREPENPCTRTEKPLLIRIVRLVENGDMVCRFFNFDDNSNVAEEQWTDDDLLKIELALRELRENYMAEIQLLFSSSHDNSYDTWLPLVYDRIIRQATSVTEQINSNKTE